MPIVTGPLTKTFAVLTAATSPESANVLLAAVESTFASISLPAAAALVDRQGTYGQKEILSRFPRLPADVQQVLRSRAERFDGLLRQMLLHSQPDEIQAGLNAVRWLQAVEQIPRLTELLCRENSPVQDAAVQCLQDLVVLLEEELRSTSVADQGRAAITSRRDRALTHLEEAVKRFEALAAKDPVIESILVLGPSQHSAVKFVLWQATPDCRERAGRLLLTSRHPRIMGHVLDSLRQSYPHPIAFEAVCTRTDVEFLCELFRYCSVKTNSTLDQNLKQIEHLAWLEVDEPPWELIPAALQPAMLSFVFSTKVSQEWKAATQDWILRNGGPAGRMAAAERTALLNEHVLKDVLVDSLNAEDEHVQAWAVTQLRQHAVPETFALLLNRLDSPLAEVRQAARQELSDFNLERVLGMLDVLDPSTAVRVGQLLRKIDADADAKLERELAGSIRPRRIRAAQAIVKLGFEDTLLQPLLLLADDGDFQLRRMTAELLESVIVPEVLIVLERLTADPHPRVRETAVHALIAWRQQSAEQFDPLLAGALS